MSRLHRGTTPVWTHSFTLKRVSLLIGAFFLASAGGCPNDSSSDPNAITLTLGEVTLSDENPQPNGPGGGGVNQPNEHNNGGDMAPSAEDAVSATVENTPVVITLRGTSTLERALSFSIASGPAQGTLGAVESLDHSSARVTYSPGGGFAGTDSFQFRAFDGQQYSLPASVSLSVYPEVRFFVTPVNGSRNLNVTGLAVAANPNYSLPEGVYTWTADGVADSGPMSSHRQRSFSFTTGGMHNVSLTLALAGLASPIACRTSAGEVTQPVTVLPWIAGTLLDASGIPLFGINVSTSDGTDTSSLLDGSYHLEVPYNWSGSVTPGGTSILFAPPTLAFASLTGDVIDANFTGNPPSQSPNLIRAGDTWRYQKGVSAVPAAWTQAGFADTAWLSGPTGIGYGDNDDATLLSDMQGNYVTVYARKTFQINDAASLSSVTLGIVYDDGFIAYINGAEVARRNMPAGAVNRNTTASNSVEPAPPENISIPTAGLLVTGTNVLAIEIHNADIGSSDLSLIPTLTIDGAGPPGDFAISGRVHDGNNAGIAGVTLAVTGLPNSTNGADGSFSVTRPAGWNGTITPSKPGFTFVPASRTYNNLSANQIGQDFIGTPSGLPVHEGFGAVTRGAESSPGGYTTYHVTSLADSGAGTLRDALSQGSRRIVFDVAGTINLSNDLLIRASYLTVAGETAPAPGVTISMSSTTWFSIEPSSSSGPAHDIIIRYLRFDGNAGGVHTNEGDILGMDGTAAAVYNVVLDHITAHESGDGVFDMRDDVHDVTVSWSLVTNTVLVTAITGTATRPRQNLSYHHNIWANCSDRIPRVRHNTQTLDFVNNVIYQWEVHEGSNGATAILDEPGEPDSSVNVVNNYYHAGVGSPAKAIVYGTNPSPGPGDDGGPPTVQPQGTVWTGSNMGQLYVTGNVLPAQNYDHWSTRATPLPIPPSAQVTTYAASTLSNAVVPLVGTQYPTAAEQALLSQIRSDMGGGVSGQPTAQGQSVQLNEDASLAILLSGTDPDNDPLGYIIATLPASGALRDNGNNHVIVSSELPYRLVNNGRTATYTPNVNFFGNDSFTFRVNDGTQNSAAATVGITVSGVNDAPGFTPPSAQTMYLGSPLVVQMTNVSAGPNESSQTVSFSATSSNQTVIPNANLVFSGAQLTITALATGGPVTITVTATDNGGNANGGLNSASAPFNVTVQPPGAAAISGQVTPVATVGAPRALGTVSLSFTGSGASAGVNYTVLTDASGNYSQPVQSGWSGTVAAASASQVVLTPASRSYASVNSGQAGQNFSGWKPPIGVPMPPFGMRDQAPPAPSPWNGAVAGWYYVDNTHPSAVDSGNPNGWPAQPRLTLPGTLAAGSVVEVRGGPYTIGTNHVLTCNGTAAAPVFVRGAPGARPRLFNSASTGRFRVGGAYAVVEEIEFDGVGPRFDIGGTHHFALRNCEIHDLQTTAIGVQLTNSVVLYNNVVRETGDWQGTADNDYHGVKVGPDPCTNCGYDTNDLWIMDSRFYHLDGDGVQVGGGGAPGEITRVHHVYVAGNEAFENRQAGFWAKVSDDVVFSQNHVHNVTRNGLGSQYECNNLWLLFNEVHDTPMAGLRPMGTGALFVIGNVVYDIQDCGIYMRVTPNGHMYFNTIVRARNAGIRHESPSPGRLANNIVAEMAGLDYHIDVEGVGSSMTNTVLWQGGAPPQIRWSAGGAPQYTTGDPTFTNSAGGDFRLLTGSAAINAGTGGGTVGGILDYYQARYGVSIRFDQLGRARPPADPCDAGAYEEP